MVLLYMDVLDNIFFCKMCYVKTGFFVDVLIMRLCLR
jgi:hypothetical protein